MGLKNYRVRGGNSWSPREIIDQDGFVYNEDELTDSLWYDFEEMCEEEGIEADGESEEFTDYIRDNLDGAIMNKQFAILDIMSDEDLMDFLHKKLPLRQRNDLSLEKGIIYFEDVPVIDLDKNADNLFDSFLNATDRGDVEMEDDEYTLDSERLLDIIIETIKENLFL